MLWGSETEMWVQVWKGNGNKIPYIFKSAFSWLFKNNGYKIALILGLHWIHLKVM